MMRVDPEAIDERFSLVRYDLSADEWQTVDEDVDYSSLVPVADAEGEVRTVLALPTETGAPVAVLDRAGNPIGTLPGHPGDRAQFGAETAADGLWVGEEALFWIRGADWFFPSQGTEEVWALSPSTQTWRQLDANEAPSGAGSGELELVVDAGVLVGDGIAYRPPTPAR